VRIGADGAARFDAKVATAAAVAASTAPVPLRLAPDWDKTHYPPAADLVVLQTQAAPSTDGWLQITIDTQMPAAVGSATPPARQQRTVSLDRTLFVDAFRCQSQCDADKYNNAALRAPVAAIALQRAASSRDITEPARETAVAKAAAPQTPRQRAERLYAFSVEDLGFGRQAPSRTYAVSLAADLQAIDGQTLSTRDRHRRELARAALTSFGDGHGVWETGAALPFYARNFTDVWQWAQAISPDRLMPTILSLASRFHAAPPVAGTRRTLGGASDKILSHGLTCRALKPGGTGLVWAAVEQGSRSRDRGRSSWRPRSTRPWCR
jgi:hypothetical protein